MTTVLLMALGAWVIGSTVGFVLLVAVAWQRDRREVRELRRVYGCPDAIPEWMTRPAHADPGPDYRYPDG